MPNVIKGKDFLMYVPVGDDIVGMCYQRTFTINTEHELRERTTKQGNKWRTYSVGRAGYSISTGGILNAVPGGGSYLEDALRSGLPIAWSGTDGTNFQYGGFVFATNYTLDAPVEDLTTFSCELRGTGEFTKIQLPTANTNPDQSGSEGGGDPITQCVTIKDQTGVIIAEVPAPSIYTVLRFNQIGGGSSIERTPPLIITPYNL